MLYGSSGGLTSVSDQFYEGRAGVADTAEEWDHFGAALVSGRCWGKDENGSLGHGSAGNIGDDESPCSVGAIDVGAPVVRLDPVNDEVDNDGVCAILENGRARCWGPGWTAPEQLPAAGIEITADLPILQMAGSRDVKCALLEGGVVRCWGRGAHLGYGDGLDRGVDSDPGTVLDTLPDVPLGGSAVELISFAASVETTTCVLLTSGGVRCWGTAATLGYGTGEAIGDDETPAEAGDVPLGGPAIALTSTYHGQCALLEDRTIRCWGEDAAIGHYGYGDIFADIDGIGDDETPAEMGPVSVGAPVSAVFGGNNRTCVLLDGGQAKCWGRDIPGSLGYGPSVPRLYEPAPEAIEIGGEVRSLALGTHHTCALLDIGFRCWGLNDAGQLGLGTTSDLEFAGFPTEEPLLEACE